MMQDIVACCNGNDINVLHRFLSVIEGICSKLEIVPDNDIVLSCGLVSNKQIGEVVIHFIEDLNKFLFDSWTSLTSLLPQVTSSR